jgi:hypothetical protein
MRNPIHAELSSDSFCTALGITVSAGGPALALCRKLTEVSTYASSTPLDAYRGDTLCLRVRSIGEAAQLEINGEGTGFRGRR